MLSSELRTKYLKFFESKGHLIHASDSLVPDDKTLLFTSAGMVQFKPYYVGERVPPCTRIVTSQKCLRTDDIDEVGDAVHHTFFEMLGNFSFGDYFKREAIVWAWEFLTDVLKLSPEHLWVSVYLDDDEAADVWLKETGIGPNRLVRLGEDKNYWPANAPSKGPNGVCGPCSEIFLDMTPELGEPEDAKWSIAYDGNRFVEIWNLVFTQYDRQEDGTLKPLPAKNIDTGMGLERTIAILQGVSNDYETDLFLPIVQAIEELSGHKCGSGEHVDTAVRVAADHIRSAVFAIADGVMPSNMGRGYVLRRLIRNAVVKAKKIGVEKSFLAGLVPVVVKLMAEPYPELVARQAFVERVVASEEEKFRRTLESGLQRLEEMVAAAEKLPEKVLGGQAVFNLYDTYGFPPELTRDIAAEKGVSIDTGGFDAAMDEQRKRAKDASDFGSVMTAGGGGLVLELEKTLAPTAFVGYEATRADAEVLGIIRDGELVSTAGEGDKVELILDRTPFYAESGGQAGDAGLILSTNVRAAVSDTVKVAKFFLHKAELLEGTVSVGDGVDAEIDLARRMAIARNHSATHLLHSALRRVLGDHALQSGSVVDANRLRFDFSHFQGVTHEELRRIENMVNEMVLADLASNTIETDNTEARKLGATALFGEKYGDKVRVVTMGDFSVELCGGTHLCRTSQVGLFKIVYEGSIGAGLRRIEAVTGEAALHYLQSLEDSAKRAAAALSVSPDDIEPAIERLQNELKEARREAEQLRAKGAADQAGELAEAGESAGGVKYVVARVDADVETLQMLADSVVDKLGSGIVILAGASGEKVTFIGKLTKDLLGKGFHVGNILREAAKIAGGGGGGRPDFAQAGGKDAAKIPEALAKTIEMIKSTAGA